MRVLVVALAVFGGWLAILPGSVETLYIHLADLGAENIVVSYAVLIGVAWGVFMLALVLGGRIGDRSTRARRATVVIGLVGLVAGGLWMFVADSPLNLMMAWVTAQIPAALIVSSALALALTHVDESRRRLASGLTGTASVFTIFIGVLVISVLDVPAQVGLAAPSVIGAIFAVPLLWLSAQDAAIALNTTSETGVPALKWRRSGWSYLLVAGFLLSCATSITNGFVVVFVSTWMKLDAGTSAGYSSVLIVIAGLASIVSGVIIGLAVPRPRRAVFIYSGSALLVGVSIALMVILPSATPVWIAGVGFGAGFGAANGLELTLVAHFQPSMTKSGQDFGLFTAATTLPYVLVPLVAAVILAADSARGISWLWWIAAVSAIGAATAMFAASRTSPSSPEHTA